MKKLMKITFISILVFGLSGCKSGTTQTTKTEPSKINTTIKQEEKRKFTDSVGREVTLPKVVSKIAPSGTLAQLFLYTSAPDLLVGVAQTFPDSAKELFSEHYLELPQFGQFYGKNASLNMEALSTADPEVIIDIGEKKETVKEDMDSLQEQLDIPVVFIEANLESMDTAYRKLGELLGQKETNQRLAEYCEQTVQEATKIKSNIKNKKRSVYYAGGQAGLSTNAEGSFHGQVLDKVGAENVVTGVGIASKGEGTTISMEQLIQWQPEIIITPSQEVYDLIKTDDTWKHLEAVKKEQIYKSPTIPYNFIGSPPSVNQLLGIKWLGNLLYPDEYKLEIDKEVSNFYQTFYHIDLTEKQLEKIMKNSY